MDAKMKGLIMSAMMALCLILGAMSIFSDAWLTETETDEGGMEYTSTMGLSNRMLTLDAGSSLMCGAAVDSFNQQFPNGEHSCDNSEFTSLISISDFCDSDLDEIDDCDYAAAAGTMGSIGMWGGVVCALIAALVLILPMAGVDAMDKMPDMAKIITSWGAGGLMLLGVLVWYMMLPDVDSSASTGLFMAICAAILGLGAPAMGKFMPADE